MKDTVKEILEHPIATIIILGTVGSVVAEIIGAIKGTPKEPLIRLVNNAPPKSQEKQGI